VPCGGATRAASVSNGLRELRRAGAIDTDWVLVHDAARCLVTPELVDRLIDTCGDDEVGGLLAHPLPDTLKIGENGRVAATIARAGKWQAQTPQMFRLGMLRQALEGADESVTDESSAIEAMGLAPMLVEAGAQNFKVTYPEDFAMAEAVLRARH
jgi:2-C-methyl-D-erythritol 4-phosphate cytidylyltransferase